MNPLFPAFFLMEFTDQNDDTKTLFYGFAAGLPIAIREQITNDIDNECEWYWKIYERLEEKYGVHDWFSSPEPEKVVCLGSYSCAETDEKHFLKLMETWKTSLSKVKKLSGTQWGKIIQFSHDTDFTSGGDYSIYEALVRAGSFD